MAHSRRNGPRSPTAREGGAVVPATPEKSLLRSILEDDAVLRRATRFVWGCFVAPILVGILFCYLLFTEKGLQAVGVVVALGFLATVYMIVDRVTSARRSNRDETRNFDDAESGRRI